jgi:hypothetical protein
VTCLVSTALARGAGLSVCGPRRDSLPEFDFGRDLGFRAMTNVIAIAENTSPSMYVPRRA